MSADQLPLDFGHRPAFGREDFVVADANRIAVAWLDRWPDWPGRAVALAGPAACGKTHLATIWAARSGARMIAAPLLSGSPDMILQGSANAVVDAGDEGVDERPLLHLYNHLRETSGYLLVTGRLPPAQWPVQLPDLRSRLASMPVLSMQAPDDALLEAVLIKLFADRQLRIAPDLIAYLLSRIERSFDSLQRVVARIDRASMSHRRNVTIALAREILETNDEPVSE